jgi:hypothetical protein
MEVTKLQKGSKYSKYNYKSSYSDWLKNQPWSFYCTGTTRYELTLPSARRLAERFFSTIQHQSSDVRMFWAAEPFDVKEGHHIHFLVYIKGMPDQGLFTTLINLWQWCTGNKALFIYKGTNKVEWEKLTWNAINIRHYDQKRNAGSYCAKYINKHKADYDYLFNSSQTPLMSTCNLAEQDFCPVGERKRKGEVYHINLKDLHKRYKSKFLN